ncbi:OmpA family protein [Photobacterium nomapromontoriensis]|uniref:OmpA family protein n=1 Tax=Photobacterium nomapromontoriensis TaxID=2910237 RepID=UPI003D103369
MRYTTWIYLCGVLLALTGCSQRFPPEGAGGFAEHHYQTISPVEVNGPLTPAHGLRFDFELTRQMLKLLVIDGAELCFPASVAQARERERRIGRELAGGLEFDAANDILVQRDQLHRIERQLSTALLIQACRLDQPQAGQTLISAVIEIEQLLNADNQFAFGSSELNLKYAGRLAQAVMRLREFPQYSLQVIGHADVIGSPSYNQQLSMSRAQQVSRYLQIFGFEKSKIEVSAVGDIAPLVNGTSATNRLVNRRVSITLVENVVDNIEIQQSTTAIYK